MKVITISGKAQHGKDTSAGIMAGLLEQKGYRVLIVHYGDLLKYICKTFFNWNGVKDVHGRSLLQHIGTDVIREQAPNYWVGFVADTLAFFKNEWDFVLIPDARFPNEIDYLKERGFDVIHVRVVRTGFTSPLSPEQQMHPSETALEHTTPDYTLHNNATLIDLLHSISSLITKIGC